MMNTTYETEQVLSCCTPLPAEMKKPYVSAKYICAGLFAA